MRIKLHVRILACADPPSAIVCDSDMLAVGVYKAAKDLQRTIPQDLSVVSFDDSIIARMLDPELTTVAIPTTVIGEQALLLLLAVLEKSHSTFSDHRSPRTGDPSIDTVG